MLLTAWRSGRPGLHGHPMEVLCVYLLHEPGHVLSKVLHRLYALIVFEDVTDFATEADAPVTRSWHHHLHVMEKEIHAAEGLNGPSPTDGYYRGPDFALKHVVIGPGDEPAPFDESPHIGGDIGKIGWGAQQDTLSRKHLINNSIKHVRLDGTVFVLVLKACVTGLTARQGGSCHLDKFRFYSFRLQFV